MSQRQQPGRGSAGGNGQPRGPLFPTQNYLSESVRGPVIELLNRTLADTTVLRTQAKFAHWNVKGMQFYALHELFDDIAEALEDHEDDLGERVTALGGQAMGTVGMAVQNSSLPRMSTDAMTGQQFVRVLADHLAVHDASLYDAIQAAQRYGDPDTADLLNEISREVSHYLWFLEAHLQSQPVQNTQVGGTGGPQQTQQQQVGLQQQPQQTQYQQQSPGTGQQTGGVGQQSTVTSPQQF